MQFYRRILLVYPKFPRTYWGMQYTLQFLGKKSSMPPLGLITIAAMTPPPYEFRLADLNCGLLSDEDLAWADMVCFSAMLPQRRSLFEAASRCQKAGKLVVFGGPFPTACPDECAPYCDVQVLNEGEITWPLFLADLERGEWRSVYASEEKPDITQTPVPRFDLLRIGDETHAVTLAALLGFAAGSVGQLSSPDEARHIIQESERRGRADSQRYDGDFGSSAVLAASLEGLAPVLAEEAPDAAGRPSVPRPDTT